MSFTDNLQHTDFTRRLKRDLGRAPTDAESEAWGRERISPQETETTFPKCATYAASIIHSMRYPNSIYSSASPAAVISSTFPEFRIAPAFAVESVPRSAAPRSSSSEEANRSRLSVEVGDYSSLSDPGLSSSSSDEESPLRSAIELESPTFVSFFSPDVLPFSDKENRAARNTAYEQRR